MLADSVNVSYSIISHCDNTFHILIVFYISMLSNILPFDNIKHIPQYTLSIITHCAIIHCTILTQNGLRDRLFHQLHSITKEFPENAILRILQPLVVREDKNTLFDYLGLNSGGYVLSSYADVRWAVFISIPPNMENEEIIKLIDSSIRMSGMVSRCLI